MKIRNHLGKFVPLPDVMQREVTAEYLSGGSVSHISRRFGIDRHTVIDLVIRSGKKPFDAKSSRSNFKTKESQELLRKRYEGGENSKQLAKEFNVSPESVLRAVRRAGGKIRSKSEPRKYFKNAKRERQVKFSYGLVVSDMEKLKQIQKCMCLWCRAPLPENVLDCVVDHIGGLETRGDKTKVRGLCCQNGHCNRIAGMIEVGKISSNSLFHPLVLRVRKILRLYSSRGPLEV